MKLKTQSDPVALRFESQQDTSDYIQKLIQDGQDFLVSHNLNLIERYRNGDFEIQLKIRLGRHVSCQYDLLFGVVPFPQGDIYLAAGDLGLNDRHAIRHDVESGTSEPCVLGIAHPVYAPKEIIPSLVRLEGAKEREDFLGKTLASSGNRIFKFLSTDREGKVRLSDRGTASLSNVVTRHVERSTKVVDDISNTFRDRIWEGFRQPEFVNSLVGVIRIDIAEAFVGLTILKSEDVPFEILNVRLCVT